MDRNPLFYIDFYKVGHVSQYHRGVRHVFSNWTPRSSRIPDTKHVVHFGLTWFLKRYLIEAFDEYFFKRPWNEIEREYTAVIRATLNIAHPKTDHIEALHRHGRMPLRFYALPEGSLVPLGCPSIIVTNTHSEFFWLPNYIETLMSNALWKPCTSATTARRYRELFLKHARRSGETDMGFIDWQGHDFSFRGMSGMEDACLSGMGHLIYFSGSDTLPAILAANRYYGADLTIGGSVSASEHSVMCAGSEEGEYETFRRLICETYPDGIVSIVSDTWDLWRVLTDYVPRLKETITNRKGLVVFRPDSGDPVKIMCGDPDSAHGDPAAYGVLRLLRQALGTMPSANGGLPMIRNARAIYGDSITVERADQILTRIIDEAKLSPFNCIFGVGSFSYEYVTRDTYGFAMKATAYKNETGEIIPIFKKPVTDNGEKFSHYGIPAVYHGPSPDQPYIVKQQATEDDLNHCAFVKVFDDGDLLVDPSFSSIRQRARVGL